MKIIFFFLLFIALITSGHAQSGYYSAATTWLNKNAILIKTVKAENGLEEDRKSVV